MKSKTIINSGYICAVLSLIIFPIPLAIAGVILGIIGINKGDDSHGVAVIIMSLIFGTIGAIVGALVMMSIYN